MLPAFLLCRWGAYGSFGAQWLGVALPVLEMKIWDILGQFVLVSQLCDNCNQIICRGEQELTEVELFLGLVVACTLYSFRAAFGYSWTASEITSYMGLTWAS